MFYGFAVWYLSVAGQCLLRRRSANMIDLRQFEANLQRVALNCLIINILV